MKTKLHHILIAACIASTALVTSAFAQDNGIVEFEVSDSERDRVERDKILNSPGEGDTRYIPRNITTPSQPQAAGRDASTSKETLKEADLKAGIPIQHKVKPENNIHPAKPSEKQAQAKPNDDAILSFNFLYYIIQKYKLQDIID